MRAILYSPDNTGSPGYKSSVSLCTQLSVKRGKAKVKIWKKDYWIEDKPSGNLLLKVLIRESYLDTNSTTSGIRSKLANLHNYLPTVGHDI